VKAETCADVSLLRLSRTDPFQSRTKIIPGNLQPHNVHPNYITRKDLKPRTAQKTL